MVKLSRHNIRYLKSTGNAIAKTTVRTADKAVTGLTRWAITDHSGISKRLLSMPKMGFLDTLLYILLQLFVSIMGAVLTGAMVFVLIAYGIPLFLFGHL